MPVNNKHHLMWLAEKAEDETLSEAEKALLDNFMKRAYEESQWEDTLMGDQEAIKLSILRKIKKEKAKTRLNTYAIAASVVLLLCLSVVLFRIQGSPVIRKLTTVAADSLQLNDGSMVFLAANSELEYPEEFLGATRQVKLLKGDAFFKVSKDPKHPFVIQSGTVKTTVLGTSFHIALAENSCTIAVATGKVKVSAGDRSIDLLPNEGAYYHNNTLKKQERSKVLLFNWFQKNLHLEQVSLEEVLTVLKFRYGVTFEVASQDILYNRLTLHLESGATLKNILDQLNYITALKFKSYDKKIKVSK